jgi:hypothetical protein
LLASRPLFRPQVRPAQPKPMVPTCGPELLAGIKADADEVNGAGLIPMLKTSHEADVAEGNVAISSPSVYIRSTLEPTFLTEVDVIGCTRWLRPPVRRSAEHALRMDREAIEIGRQNPGLSGRELAFPACTRRACARRAPDEARRPRRSSSRSTVSRARPGRQRPSVAWSERCVCTR